ncbi:DUF5719 family protein [Glaciibacter superstes]|uniref:DUF5719 family protein n=1 Tax=Glaciibacter superstes TaxID=501023 RepID=UPI0003B4C01E|nr:DUF5719 family protein [Glaciibacter superstes]
MPSKHGLALFGVRAVSGLVGIGVAVVAVAAAALVPWPTAPAPPPSAIVSPQPADQQRVCPGPLLTLAEDSAQASTATSVGGADGTFAALEPGSDELISPEVTDLDAADNTDSASDGAPQLLSADVPDGATEAPLVAGSQSQTASGETLSGFAAAACGEAASDSWLVGGSTDIGHTSLVLLSNPTEVVATVDLIVYSETGLVDAPGSTGILVQPGSQRIVSLAGLAPNVKSTVVHVQSQGGQVAASLEQSLIHGIVPAGVELIGPSTQPTTVQSIVGLQVTTPVAAVTDDGHDHADEGVPAIRVLVPGDSPATVQIGVQSESGSADGTSLQVELEPGIATEVPLDGLTPGSYTVTLDSNQPVVAAARTTATGEAEDFAWFTTSGTLSRDFLLGVADGPTPTLHVFNSKATDAELTLTPQSGEAIDLVVPGGQSVIVSLKPSSRYSVSGADGTVASVGYAGDGRVSSFAVQPAGPLATPITVYAH